MSKLYCSIVCLLLFTGLYGRPKDTLDAYRLKGIDVSFGAISNTIGRTANINLLKAISPADYSARYNYNKATTDDVQINPVKLGLGIVFGNNRTNNQFFFNKHEWMFRFSFETIQSQNNYRNVAFTLNPAVVDTVQFNYTYQTQTIGLGYQLATKQVLKNLALFGSLNADFGAVTFKQIHEIRYKKNLTAYDIKNYYTTILRSNAILGLKYNFSCDINFFLQAEFGTIHYGKAIGTNSTYLGVAFGIRYKFLEEQDKLNYKNQGFW